MMRARPGAVLATGLTAMVAVALMPAGVHGERVSALSFAVWALATLAAVVVLRVAVGHVAGVLRRMLWLVPPVVLLTLPAVYFALHDDAWTLGVALAARSLCAATVGLATVTLLGPAGVVAGSRALRVPDRLVEIAHGMLVSMSAIVRQASAMLRAREARGAGAGPWRPLVAAPTQTPRWVGRLVVALLLRAVERAEALDRARRARGLDA